MKRAIQSLPPGPRKALERLADVLEFLDVITDALDTMGVALDDVLRTLAELVKERPALNASLPPVAGRARRRHPPAPADGQAASSVNLKWGPDSAEVIIDGRRLQLPPRLGLLLETLLAGSNGAPGHPRNGWLTREEIGRRLSQQTGCPVTRHALENLLSRLKKELREQAQLEALLRYDPRLGIRFAVQEQPAEGVLAPAQPAEQPIVHG
jgi:hypothetical protein